MNYPFVDFQGWGYPYKDSSDDVLWVHKTNTAYDDLRSAIMLQTLQSDKDTSLEDVAATYDDDKKGEAPMHYVKIAINMDATGGSAATRTTTRNSSTGSASSTAGRPSTGSRPRSSSATARPTRRTGASRATSSRRARTSTATSRSTRSTSGRT